MISNYKNIFIVLLIVNILGCHDQSAELKPRNNRSYNKWFPDAYSECSKLESPENGVKGILSTIYDKKQFLPKIVQLDILEIPETMYENTKSFFQVTAWKVVNGKKEKRLIPVPVIYINKSSGAPIYKAYVDRIWPQSFDIAMEVGKLDRKQYNEKEFLKNFSMLLVNIEEEWEGITLNYFAVEDTDPVYSVDAILPPFAANPNTYAETVNGESTLTKLHPLNHLVSEKTNDDTYKKRADAICNFFDSDVAVPRPKFEFYNETLSKLKTFLNSLKN